jgi:tetratricopeptide (TPR) repeat protein
MHPIFERLKERKLVQWALAYLAGAWLATQVLDTVAGPWGLSDTLLRSVQIVLVFGFLAAMVLAWYHGERGLQRVSASELGVLGLIFAGCTGALSNVWSRTEPSGSSTTTTEASTGGVARILVIPPENDTGRSDLDAWGRLAADAMRRAITENTEMDVVAASRVRGILGSSAESGDFIDALSRSGASWAIASSYVLLGESLSLSVEIFGGKDGDVLRTLAPVGVPLDSLESGLTRVEQGIAVAAIMLEPYDGWLLRLNSIAPTPEAARLLIQARSALCASRQEDAVQLAKRAVALEPDWQGPYLVLRPALFNLGRDTEWEAMYEERLLGLIPQMTEFERYTWEFQEGATTEDRLHGAVGGLRLTRGEGPFNQGYAVAFRALQLNYLDLAREGMNTIGDADGPCASGFGYRWVVDGQLHHLGRDFESELMTLREGLERFPTNHMLLRDETVALAALDQVHDLPARLDRLQALPVPADSVWNALHDVALELKVHGHEDQAVLALGRLVDWGASRSLSDFRQGHALYDAGRYGESEPLLRAALDESVTAPALASLAMTLDRLGRSDEADPYVRQLETWEGIVPYGDHAPEEYPASRWPAIVAASRGELDRAVELLRIAFEKGLRYYDLNQMQLHTRPELATLRDHEGFRQIVSPRPYVDDPTR